MSGRFLLVSFLLALIASPQGPEPLGILHVTPDSVVAPVDPVTVTFDRPVSGSLDRVVDARSIARLEPALPARFDWRDPSTLRVIPAEPWTPGQVITLVIDTTFVAMDGTRLTRPARIPIRVRGPRMRTIVPPLQAERPAALPPDGKIIILYSSSVDSALLARTLRFEFNRSATCRGTVPIRAGAQRPLADDDRWELRYGSGIDSIARQWARVVELSPASPLPDGCDGVVIVPSLDSTDAAELRYPVRTAPALAVTVVHCAVADDCASSGALIVSFTAPVRTDAARRLIQVDGVPVELNGQHGPVMTFVGLTTTLPPRSTRSITIDPSLTDVAGRPLTGTREFVIETGDRPPRVTHAAGFLTLSRDATPVLRVSHVNVDSAELELRTLNASGILGMVLGTFGFQSWNPRISTFRSIKLVGAPNEIRSSDVELPELRSLAGEALAVRVRLRRGVRGIRPSVIRSVSGTRTTTVRDTMTSAPALLQRTSLAVHARIDEIGGAVFVTRLRDNRPVANATVTLRDENGLEIVRETTNSSGLAVIEDRADLADRTTAIRNGARPGRIIDVQHNGDNAMLPVALDSRNSLDGAAGAEWSLGYWHNPVRWRRTVVFTDRDLYRPGERVFLSAIARDGRLDRLGVPESGERPRWVVRRMVGADGPQVIHDRTGFFTRFGTSVDSFTIATRSPLGEYHAELQRRIGQTWVAVASTQFQVLEYRAPEFAVDVAGDSVPRWSGDTLRFRVKGRYLYDAPMRGSSVRWNATWSIASPWDLQIPRLPDGFDFGDHPSGWEGLSREETGHHEIGSETLDSLGARTIHVATTRRFDHTMQVSFSVAVEDVNRQVVTSSHDQVLHGSDFYIAIREFGDPWWRVNNPVRLELLAVRPDGSRAGGESITARLVRTRWVDSSGTGAWRLVTDSVATWSLSSADSALAFSFTPREGGYYTLQLSGQDKRGRAVQSRIRRMAWGGFGRANGPATRLTIEADTIRHALGASAMLRFESPFDAADAWVTIEREGLLRQLRRQVRRGPNEIAIPVTADMAPNAVVGVVLLNRAPGQPADSLHKRFMTGMANVRVDSMVKRLRVSVAPAEREVVPGAQTGVILNVTDMNGRGVPAAVTLWAVDEGVLSMGWYGRPDPVNALQSHESRWLALASTLPSANPYPTNRRPSLDLSRTAEARLGFAAAGSMHLSEVVVTGTGSAVIYGARAMSSAVATLDVRDDFRTTAFFRAMALTDSSGRATVSVRLPDNITTYRLFAVAVGIDDRAGSAESTFVATRPLVVRAAMPRFVRPGDELQAGGVVGTRDATPRDVQVDVTGDGIAVEGSPTKALKLTSGSGEARFTWRARESDSARVTIAASDGASSDAVRVVLPVQPDRFPTAESVTGIVRDTATVRLTLPPDIDLHRSHLTIRAGTSPMPLIESAREYLRLYPYACTEQLMATGRVLVASLVLQRAGLPVGTDPRSLTTALQVVVDRLSERQRNDGAFGYWSNDSWSTPWLSTTVGLLLVDASGAGARVDTAVTTRLSGYLARSIDTISILPDTTLGTRADRRRTAANHLGNRLAAATFLRRIGKPRQAEETLLLQRESLMAWEDRVLLAHVLHDAGRSSESRSLLQRAWRAVGTAGLRADFPDSISGRGLFRSHVRPVARLVAATAAIEPTHPRLGTLMERLVSRTRAHGLQPWNTQDYASAAMAIASFFRAVPAGTSQLNARVDFATGTSQSIVLRSVRGAATDTTIAMTGANAPTGDSLVVTIRLTAQNGPVFYAVTSAHVSSRPDTRPTTKGLVVERWYERFDNGAAVTEVQAGDLVRVRLRVTVPSDREFVAVEDPLPAGLEAVDLSLRSSGTLGPFSTEAGDVMRAQRDREAAAGSAVGSWDSGWWSPWEHSEKRDDRVTWFARSLFSGTYTASYVARATTSGRFIRPPARAEEMYNAAVSGRSEGGTFVVRDRR